MSRNSPALMFGDWQLIGNISQVSEFFGHGKGQSDNTHLGKVGVCIHERRDLRYDSAETRNNHLTDCRVRPEGVCIEYHFWNTYAVII